MPSAGKPKLRLMVQMKDLAVVNYGPEKYSVELREIARATIRDTSTANIHSFKSGISRVKEGSSTRTLKL